MAKEQLLVLGLPRTGTQSIKEALESIGHPDIYHMGEVPKNPTHPAMWAKLLERKTSDPEALLTAEDFDPILEKYPGGISDFPASIFGVDLIQAYPQAKVLITTREEDRWTDSIMRTLVAGHREAEAERDAKLERGEELGQLDEDRYKLRKGYHTYCWKDDFPSHGRQYWRDYQQAVRDAAEKHRAKDQVLVYNPREGWEPLCKFVGLSVPEKPFPHEGKNDSWARK